jgi:hypothetical protein
MLVQLITNIMQKTLYHTGFNPLNEISRKTKLFDILWLLITLYMISALVVVYRIQFKGDHLAISYIFCS